MPAMPTWPAGPRSWRNGSPLEALEWAGRAVCRPADVRHRVRPGRVRAHRPDRPPAPADRHIHARHRTRVPGDVRAVAAPGGALRPAHSRVSSRSCPWRARPPCTAKSCGERQPERCCHMRKVVPLRAELARVDAWITAIRRDQTPQRAGALVVEPDEKVRHRKGQPRSCAGPRSRCGHTSWSTTCRTTPCTTAAIPASGAPPAPAPSSPARTSAPGAGAARPRPSAGCMDRGPHLPPRRTLRQHFCRIQRGPSTAVSHVFVFLIYRDLPIS